MGRFSTTLNIKNNSDREGFLKSFCGMMKKRGFVKCNEDEAAVSYALAFGDGWITLANEDYKDNIKKAYDERKLISEEMKTAAFTVEVVDSDFAILCLNSNGRTSKIVVGDGEGYGVEKSPFEADDWKPLIKNGDSEKFLEAVGQDDVFAEQTLSVTAEILGIDTYYIDADFDEVLEKSDDKNVTVLYFKEGAERAMSLNAAFKKVFGAALEPLGYKLIKSKHPYYVRVVSNEIIHVISYYNAKHYPNENNIVIKGGVATVYRQKIDFSRTPRDENWLTNNCDIYINRLRHGFEELDEELKHNLYYHASKPEDILDEMEYQLSLTKRFLLPALDKAMTIDSCIENKFELRMDLNVYDDGSFGTKYADGYHNESILYFKTDRSVYENIVKNATSEGALRRKAYFERVQNDPDLYKEVQAELERKKAQNTEILRSYGVDI